MPVHYLPVSNPRSAPDAGREMEDAFDLGNDDENEVHNAHESTPLTYSTSPITTPQESSSRTETTALPGGYDFEREYDFPPPGSPPAPSSRALPNDFGNSNGFLPTAPIAIPKPRQSFFRRIAGVILPTHYQPIPTEQHSSRPTGGGTENDGVFANVTAKPQAPRTVLSADGEVHIVPEDSQKESPPSYLEAQADAVPPYWETTIHAPAGLEGNDLIIDDLPTGSFLIFCINIFISFFFQFAGFLLTYLLHTSHAAKFGSRAGLGLTLIQYGFYSRAAMVNESSDDDASAVPTDANWGTGTTTAADPTAPTPTQPDMVSPSSRDWLSFLFMTLGWFLLLSSIIGYWRVKRWEASVRAAATPTTPTPAQLQRDRSVRRNLEEVFGFRFDEEPAPEEQEELVRRDSSGNIVPVSPSEIVLTRNLRAAGII